jgi:UDP-N-acetylglucosamine:LPS N-acetylglucosamine transferase
MTTLMVAAPGGHIAELMALAPRLQGADGDYVWVTWHSPQTMSLLSARPTIWTRPVESRDGLAAMRELSRAFSTMRALRPRAVVSTGSAIAVPYLLVAAMAGIPAHYVEAATRTSAPSLTGRILKRVPGVTTYTQFPEGSNERWLFRGSVFDGYTSVHDAPRALRRIVVALGTMPQPFRRAVERLVEIIPAGVDVLWQTGHTPTDGLPVAPRPFLPAAELHNAMRNADVVIGHSGVGTALAALQAGRLPLLLPRDPARREVIDAHQVELGTHLARRGLARVRDADNLTIDDLLHPTAVRVLQQEPPPFQLHAPPRQLRSLPQ